MGQNDLRWTLVCFMLSMSRVTQCVVKLLIIHAHSIIFVITSATELILHQPLVIKKAFCL